MTKKIHLIPHSEPILVSEFRSEFHIMNVFGFLLISGLMICGFYFHFSTAQDSFFSFELILGLTGLLVLLVSSINLLRNSYVIWIFYENEVVVKSIYINRVIKFEADQIVNYESNHERSQFETGESDGYKIFSFFVNLNENTEPKELSMDQFTFKNFFEMRQNILEMANYKRDRDS